MNKLKALGTAAVISVSALSGAMPATADYMEWKFVDYTVEGTPVFYDIRHVARKGSVVLMPTRAGNGIDIFAVDCDRGMYSVSLDGDYFDNEAPIAPNSVADALAGEVCY